MPVVPTAVVATAAVVTTAVVSTIVVVAVTAPSAETKEEAGAGTVAGVIVGAVRIIIATIIATIRVVVIVRRIWIVIWRTYPDPYRHLGVCRSCGYYQEHCRDEREFDDSSLHSLKPSFPG